MMGFQCENEQFSLCEMNEKQKEKKNKVCFVDD